MQKEYFDIRDLLPIGLTLVVLGIGLSYGLTVMEDVEDDFIDETLNCNTTAGSASTTSCGVAYNATGDAIEGVAKLPEKLPLIVTVIVAAVIIGILVRYLMVRFG